MKFLENKEEVNMSKTQLTLSGRIVWSLSPSNNPIERVASKSKEGAQLYDKSGQPMMKTVFSLAIPKNSPQIQMLQQAQQTEIYKLYPSGQIPKNFAMKMIDGDTDVDDKGKPYSLREGHAGHFIIALSSLWPVNWYQFDGVNYNEINTGVKTGDFVDVNLTLTVHGPSAKGGAAGLYVEPKAVLFKGVGDAIVKKAVVADPAKMFGGSQSAPAFGQQQAAPAFGQQQVYQQPQVQQPVQQANPFAQQTQQAAPVQPYHAALPPQFRQQ